MKTRDRRIKYKLVAKPLVNISKSIFGDRNKKFFKSQKQQPFFIFGSGRNGSTLLSALLNKNPRIFIPPEQYVLPYAIMKWYLYRHLPRKKALEIIAKDFLNPSKNNNWEISYSDIVQELHGNISSKWSLQTLIEFLYGNYGKKMGKKDFVWGDKSPLSTHFMPLISSLYPSSKYIYLVRDPRDVVVSASKMGKEFAMRDYKFATWKWNDSYQQYENLKKQGKKLIMVKYKDLVNDPENETKRITEFLEIKWHPEMLDHRNETDPMKINQLSHHKNLKNSINTKSVGRWKYELKEEEILKVEKLVSENMKKLGYKPYK